MRRHRWAMPTLLAGLLLAGPVGMAAAEDGSATASQTPSGTATASETSSSAPSAPDAAASTGAATASETTTTDPSPTPDANEKPIAKADTLTIDAGQRVEVNVLANDTDDGLPEGSMLKVTGAVGSDGRYALVEGKVYFTAAASDAGTYAGRYRISDGELLSDLTPITVTVRAATKPSVSVGLATSPVALRRYAISGRVFPVGPSARATVTVQKRFPDGWRRFAVTRARDDGRWSVPFSTDRPGVVTFRARAVLRDGRAAMSSAIRRTVVVRADARVSGPLTARQVPYSWRAGCPVSPSRLRKVTVNRLTYQNRIARGTLVVHASAAPAMVRVFTAAINQRFPIRMMKPTDAFYAGGRRTPMESDKAAMRAGNTSAFNCRPVTGNPYRVSQHSYGNAIDINTIENPYVTGSQVYPSTSRSYLDRSPYRRGMILSRGVVASRMRAQGWLWGARWAHPDYQHFSSNGG